MQNTKKIPAEVYSRIVGYFRPVNQWNKGKREEFNERKDFSLKEFKHNSFEKQKAEIICN